MQEYDASEQDVLLGVFIDMLDRVSKDGGNKRAAGLKPPWWRDQAHEAAIFSHISKWKHGELVDADSGQHPLVHLAWRALSIAYQETYGQRDPLTVPEFQVTYAPPATCACEGKCANCDQYITTDNSSDSITAQAPLAAEAVTHMEYSSASPMDSQAIHAADQCFDQHAVKTEKLSGTYLCLLDRGHEGQHSNSRHEDNEYAVRW